MYWARRETPMGNESAIGARMRPHPKGGFMVAGSIGSKIEISPAVDADTLAYRVDDASGGCLGPQTRYVAGQHAFATALEKIGANYVVLGCMGGRFPRPALGLKINPACGVVEGKRYVAGGRNANLWGMRERVLRFPIPRRIIGLQPKASDLPPEIQALLPKPWKPPIQWPAWITLSHPEVVGFVKEEGIKPTWQELLWMQLDLSLGVSAAFRYQFPGNARGMAIVELADQSSLVGANVELAGRPADLWFAVMKGGSISSPVRVEMPGEQQMWTMRRVKIGSKKPTFMAAGFARPEPKSPATNALVARVHVDPGDVPVVDWICTYNFKTASVAHELALTADGLITVVGGAGHTAAPVPQDAFAMKIKPSDGSVVDCKWYAKPNGDALFTTVERTDDQGGFAAAGWHQRESQGLRQAWVVSLDRSGGTPASKYPVGCVLHKHGMPTRMPQPNKPVPQPAERVKLDIRAVAWDGKQVDPRMDDEPVCP